MIETKEQYEFLKKLTKEMVDYGMQQDILETIEALRKVARYAEHTRVEDCDVWGGGACNCGLQEALDALPDWILEE